MEAAIEMLDHGWPRVVVPDWIDVGFGPFDSVETGDERTAAPSISFADIGGIQMMLGADFLPAHRLLIAHSQGKIYFTPVASPVFRRM